MITDNGKDIIAKYLIGQVPSFATHIAVGCGSKPLKNTDALNVGDSQTKSVLDFEMARAQIISQGFVDQNYTYAITNKAKTDNVVTLTIGSHILSIGDVIVVDLTTLDTNFEGTFRISNTTPTTVSYYFPGNNVASVSTTGTLTATKTKVALTAALPSENRYEITEVGLWSAGNNILATGTDSRLLASFSDSWQGHSTSVFSPPFKTSIGTTSGIDQQNSVAPEKMFYVSTANTTFHTGDRRERKEGPRFGNTALLIRGDTSNITGSSGLWQISDITNNITYKKLSSDSGTAIATIKTDVVSPINVGDIIVVTNVDAKFNGTYSVLSIEPSTKSITYQKDLYSITSISGSGTVVTYSMPDTSGLVAGQSIKISGATVSGFNGVKTIASVTANTNITVNDTATGSTSTALLGVEEVSVSGTVTTASTHIHLNNFNFNIGENSPSDELALAFSIIDKDSVGQDPPDSVKIFMEFYRNEISLTPTGVAKKEITVTSTELTSSRYQTVRFKISDLLTDENFSAADITVCRIFTSIIKDGAISPDYYICYDGFRLDNVTTDNPVYKLSGYSVVQNTNGYPIIKLPNSNNYIEFRLTLGIT